MYLVSFYRYGFRHSFHSDIIQCNQEFMMFENDSIFEKIPILSLLRSRQSILKAYCIITQIKSEDEMNDVLISKTLPSPTKYTFSYPHTICAYMCPKFSLNINMTTITVIIDFICYVNQYTLVTALFYLLITSRRNFITKKNRNTILI